MKTVRALVAGLVLMVVLAVPPSASAATWSLFVLHPDGVSVYVEGPFQSEAECRERASTLVIRGLAMITTCFVPQ